MLPSLSRLLPAWIRTLRLRYILQYITSSDHGLTTCQAHAVERAFAAQRQYLVIANKAKKPDMTSPAFSELIKDLQQEMGTVTEIKDSNRASPFKDHLNMVAEGMGGLQWVVFEGKPADYVAEILGGVQLFGNRVLKEYKDKFVAQPPSLSDYIN